MFRVTGHARSTGSTAYQVDAALPLFVNCCGYQHFTSRDFSIQRPTGRLDYQILYIHKGCGHFFISVQTQKDRVPGAFLPGTQPLTIRTITVQFSFCFYRLLPLFTVLPPDESVLSSSPALHEQHRSQPYSPSVCALHEPAPLPHASHQSDPATPQPQLRL